MNYSSRTRLLAYQRCPRSRYWLHEADGHGWEPRKLAVPLATGAAVHTGLAGLLGGEKISSVVNVTLGKYDAECTARGLEVAQLEDSSQVYQEQRALVEALLRLAASRVVPSLLETYEVLEIEKQDEVEMLPGLMWRSIPDGLLRHRESGDLYLLSWKTPADLPRRANPRIDMQGLSEAWAWETAHPGAGQIRGVQMVYLLKGRKVKLHEAEEGPASSGAKRHDSALVWGWRNAASEGSEEWGASRYWTCLEPHSMRRSQYYPDGVCSGGRRHNRPGNWELFPAWVGPGIGPWLDWLAENDPAELDRSWCLPPPNFRQRGDLEAWLRQAQSEEAEIRYGLSMEQAEDWLDWAFPQHTEKWCLDTYGRQCAAYPICWEGVDPAHSELYQIKTQREAHKAEEEGS